LRITGAGSRVESLEEPTVVPRGGGLGMRTIRIWGVLALAVGAVLLTGPAPASAEFQLDVYAGGALTNNVDLSFTGIGGNGSTGA
jgi:hypothetical protein